MEVPPIAFAHRGARGHAPENTIEAFSLARKLGATGIESDVWLTADGVCVLDHDGIVRQGLRRKPIGTVARDDLPPHIPTLGDLLELAGDELHLSLDLKGADTGPAVIETVRARAPGRMARVWLCHSDHAVLASLRELDPGVRLVDSTRLKAIPEKPERRAATLAELGIDAVNLHHSDWTSGHVAMFHRFDVRCFAWDAQHEHLIAAVLRMGIDGVFSDWVDRMVDTFAAEGR
jgi:glycerophosphoryl diester phosphodiesterase